VTIDDLYLLLAETRCEHGHLTLEDATRTADPADPADPAADDWTAYLRDPAHPYPYEVRDFAAFQTHAPALPPAWLGPHTRAERTGRDDGAAPASITLPDLARILADLATGPDTDGPAWRLHALHRASPPSAGTDATYLVELGDPATAEVRTAPSLAAYRHLRGCPALATP